MNFLLDTNIVSELRKRKPHGAVLSWYRAHPETAYAISAVTLFEMQAGAEITRRNDMAKAAEIERWIEEISAASTILPLADRAARETARILHGLSLDLLEDAMIAATARVHKLTIATRNTRDFAHFGVPQVNPFLFRKP